jgi:uncharacterized membrane protein SpoIIM required for sporulation
MISTTWVKRRQPNWERLDSLLKISEKQGLKSLSRTELQELTLLYRQTAADLSTLREDVSGKQLATHVNQLLGRAHNTIYFGKRDSISGVFAFFRNQYPVLFRRHFPLFVASVALFCVGAVVGLVLTASNPDFAVHVVGPEMVRKIEHREMWTNSIVAIKPLASSGITTNNMSVAFATFAFGITGGVVTAYMLVFNGLLLGVIGTACFRSGLSLGLWSFVAPHGVLELPAIFIAGAAGLLIAKGLLFPGTLPRGLSLQRNGAEAIRLLLGVIPMLIVAGLLEGFFSPSKLPVSLKFGVAAGMETLLILYLASSPGAKSSSAP